MLTVQTNIALQIIATLSEEEKQVFAVEFEKMYKPAAKGKQKKQVQPILLNPAVLGQQILAKHRAKSQYPSARKLA